MVDKKTLIRQHEEIYEVISDLKRNMDAADDLEARAFEIAQKISLLAGKLKIHLVTEDQYMYPYILEKGSQELKALAQGYMEEMGTISGEFTEYKNRFNTKSKIISNLNEFKVETLKIIKVLEGRMGKEDSNLYRYF